MTTGWGPIYLVLWTTAVFGPEESFLGLHTAPRLFQDTEEFDGGFGGVDSGTAEGLEVIFVVENSPAQQAGIQVGDVVLRLNGRAPRSPRHLASMAAALPVGDAALLEFQRGERILEVVARTVLRLVPQEEPQVRAFVERRRLGLVVEDVVAGAAAAPAGGASPSTLVGVRIRRFVKGGIGPDAGLAIGDVVLEVGAETVHGGEDFLVLARELPTGAPVRMLVSRRGERIEVAVAVRDPGRHVSKVFFPLIVDYERDDEQDRLSFGILPFNMVKYERRENRRTYCILWFICFSTGSNEVLTDVR